MVPGRAGRPHRGQFPFGMRQAMKRRGRDQYRHRNLLSEQGERQIALAHIHQHAVVDAEALECGAILAQCHFIPRAAGKIIVGALRELLPGQLFQLGQV